MKSIFTVSPFELDQILYCCVLNTAENEMKYKFDYPILNDNLLSFFFSLTLLTLAWDDFVGIDWTIAVCGFVKRGDFIHFHFFVFFIRIRSLLIERNQWRQQKKNERQKRKNITRLKFCTQQCPGALVIRFTFFSLQFFFISFKSL